MSTNRTERERMMQLLLEVRNRQKQETAEKDAKVIQPKTELVVSAPATLEGSQNGIKLPISGITIVPSDKSKVWNERQLMAIDMALAGKSFVLIGAAGTGKTSVEVEIVVQMIRHGKVAPIRANTKYLQIGAPGVVVTSFTNRAVLNSAKPMPQDLKRNCITIHKFLEFGPNFYTEIDDSGNERNKVEFVPKWTSSNRIPTPIGFMITDEASMVSVELNEQREQAFCNKVQHLYSGDIQQLPPVYGSAILGFKMLELPVIELTEVYRQALDSPILRLAHHILKGKMISAKDFKDWNEEGKLTIHPWKIKQTTGLALKAVCGFLHKAIDAGNYKPDTDVILCPYNKEFGTIELNKSIAQKLGDDRKATVHEIIAGFEKHYYAVGDKVLYQKEDCHIVKITKNHSYLGKKPQAASEYLDRWGILQTAAMPADHSAEIAADLALQSELTVEDVEAMLDSMNIEDIEDRTNQASHVITLAMDYGSEQEREIVLNTSAEINGLLFGYALTVHKAQGSEWRKVFFISHRSHQRMLQRELIYTAITRAREELYIICEPDMFITGVQSQRIKGDTLAEKAEYFKGKLDQYQKEQNRLTHINPNRITFN